MNIWLIKIGEPLEIDAEDARLLRYGILARVLVERGHKVLWWTSNFDHTKREYRPGKHGFRKSPGGYEVFLLKGTAYKGSVSLRRILHHITSALSFYWESKKQQAPDIILCSLPIVELAYACVLYAKKKDIPVILDARDQWPDLLVEIFPKWTQRFIKMILSPMFFMTRRVCSKANCLTGITDRYVDWVINYAKRPRTKFDKSFSLASRKETPAKNNIIRAEGFWKKYNLNSREFNVCFVGTMSSKLELETVIDAAYKIQKLNLPIRFFLCGTGGRLKKYQGLAKGCGNVMFPGWINRDQIWVLLSRSSIGLVPYASRPDFVISIPTKAIEYLSMELPIGSSLEGELEELLAKHTVGFTYPNKDTDSLVSHLVDLYTNQNKTIEMAKNSQAVFKSKFDAEKVYGAFENHMVAIEAMHKKTY